MRRHTPDEEKAADALLTLNEGQRPPVQHPGWSYTRRTAPSIFAARQPSQPTKTTSPDITYVCFHKDSRKWNVGIRLGKRKHSLGYFNSQEKAGRHLLDVLKTLRHPAENLTEAALKYAIKITSIVTITSRDKLDEKIATLEIELHYIAAQEERTHRSGVLI
ncbi:MAG: hypothetical protein P1U40_05825 [Coxiellaceae bacterium]|nr:hypothetical protein [Coxiellaceae bacterium]